MLVSKKIFLSIASSMINQTLHYFRKWSLGIYSPRLDSQM